MIFGHNSETAIPTIETMVFEWVKEIKTLGVTITCDLKNMEIKKLQYKIQNNKKNAKTLVLQNPKSGGKNNNNQIPCPTKSNPPCNCAPITRQPEGKKKTKGPNYKLYLENLQGPDKHPPFWKKFTF